jgi:hypothetical protein
MNRVSMPVLAVAVLALAGCTSSSTTASSSSAPSAAVSRPAAQATIKVVVSSPAVNTPTAAKTTPAPAKTCPAAPDIYVWMRSPGVPDYAQRLGGIDQQNCEPSFKSLAAAAPTTPGSCTQGAWVSDNPGYDPDATPAQRLKKVQFSVGPAC